MDPVIRQNTKARVNLACPECGMDLKKAPNGGFAKYGDRRLRIPGRSEHTGSGELHRAVADPVDRHRRAGKCEPAAERCLWHRVLPL